AIRPGEPGVGPRSKCLGGFGAEERSGWRSAPFFEEPRSGCPHARAMPNNAICSGRTLAWTRHFPLAYCAAPSAVRGRGVLDQASLRAAARLAVLSQLSGLTAVACPAGERQAGQALRLSSPCCRQNPETP